MKAQSAKAKGRLGQQEIVKLLLKALPGLQEEDIRSTSMGAPGRDILLSTAALEAIPWCIEVKRRKKIAALDFLTQADYNSKEGEEPIVFCREDRGRWVVMMDAEYFLERHLK